MSEIDQGRDPLLADLFARSEPELEGKEFSAGVMARTRNVTLLVIGVAAAVATVAALTAWAIGVPFEFAELVAEAMTRPLIHLPQGWFAFAFAPINNIGALLILLFKVFRVIQKRSAN